MIKKRAGISKPFKKDKIHSKKIKILAVARPPLLQSVQIHPSAFSGLYAHRKLTDPC